MKRGGGYAALHADAYVPQESPTDVKNHTYLHLVGRISDEFSLIAQKHLIQFYARTRTTQLPGADYLITLCSDMHNF